jgi:Zn finger protein HypA/HybF involved in hydrogenase expression
MHEVSLVGELVEACQRATGGAPVRRVAIRHASSIPEEAVRQAFVLLAAGTPLGEARLELSAFEIEVRCDCGFAGPLDHDDLPGAAFVECPSCGSLVKRPRTPELELVALER